MKKLILSLLAGAAIATSINAQDAESSPLTLSGSVDTYYRTTLNTSDQDGPSATNTSFANGVGFNVGMVNLIASKEGEKSGFVADVVFGPRGDEATFSGGVLGGGTSAAVNQLYAYWNINDMFTLTAGNFNTFLGYEVISPSANFNYSTSHMFSWGPFSHTGVKLDVAATDELSFMGALLNPTDEKTLNGLGNNLYVGLQAGYELENGGIWLNYLGGNSGPDGSDTTGFHQIDLTTGFNWTDELYLGLNATVASASTNDDDDDNTPSAEGFWGIAGYAQYSLSDAVSLGGRAEYFSASNGTAAAIGLPTAQASDTDINTAGAVMDLTLSANIKVGDLTFIPEIRADFYLNALDEVTTTTTAVDGSTYGVNKAGDLTKALGSFSIAAVYTF